MILAEFGRQVIQERCETTCSSSSWTQPEGVALAAIAVLAASFSVWSSLSEGRRWLRYVVAGLCPIALVANYLVWRAAQ